MRLDAQTRHLDTNLNAVTDFEINATAHAFQILSSNLYSDPVLAVIRELICNAWDAHARAGKLDVPINVHLPTSMDMELRVKDQGTGISHHAMTHHYISVFKSDKNETNDEIGGLGLGRMSVYSLTDQFHLRSIFMGVARRYTAFIQANGKPGIVPVGLPEVVENEPDGFEVIVPVSPDKIHSFSGRYARFVQTMPVKPISNCHEEFNPPEVLMSHAVGDGYRIDILKNSRDMPHQYDSPIVMMGIVPYTITGAQKYDLPELFRNRGVIIHAPIGGFQVSPSREGLSLKPEDYERMHRLAEDFALAVKPFFMDKIKAATNAFELSTTHHDMFNTTVFARLYRNLLKQQDLRWKGYSLRNDIAPQSLLEVPVANFNVNNLNVSFSRRASKARLVRMSNPYSTYNGKTLRPNVILYAEKNKPYRHMIDFDDLRDKDTVWVLTGDLAAIERWLKFYGFWDDAEEITKAPPKPRTSSDGTSTVRQSFGSFRYELRTIDTVGRETDREGDSRTRASVADIEQNLASDVDHPIVLMAQSIPTNLQRITKPGRVLLRVNVPDSHKKVAKYIEDNLATYNTWVEYVRDHVDLDLVLDAMCHTALHNRVEKSLPLLSAANQIHQWRHAEWSLEPLHYPRAEYIEPAGTLSQRMQWFAMRYQQLTVLTYSVDSLDYLLREAWPDLQERADANLKSWINFMDCIEKEITDLKSKAPALFNNLPKDTPQELINAYLKEVKYDQ